VALRLFEHPLSPYARKVKLVLYEKGVAFERVFVNPLLGREEPVFREFAAASPRLEVPCLVHDGFAVFDSTIQLDYIEECWPEPPSLPADPRERARVRMLEEICDTQYEAVNWGLMELRFFRRAEGAEAEGLLGCAARQLARLRDRLERELAARPWLNGERFGRGDAAALPHVTGSASFGSPLEAARHPRLAEWVERCRARESVRREAEELAESLRRELGAGPAGPGLPLVRQYRDHRLEWMMRSGGVDVVLRGLRAGTIHFSEEL
jgi:glutathione S-transferase/RNA polymerase-associated protein